MKKLLILSLLICTPVMASCDNFDGCMKAVEVYAKQDRPINYSNDFYSAIYLRAIAFKLDEISRKLGEGNK